MTYAEEMTGVYAAMGVSSAHVTGETPIGHALWGFDKLNHRVKDQL